MNTTDKNSFFSSYYQAHVQRELCWFLTATLRSYEHVSFDRTLNVQESIFEFFVPVSMEPYFLKIMESYQQEGVISNLVKLPNRLVDETETF